MCQINIYNHKIINNTEIIILLNSEKLNKRQTQSLDKTNSDNSHNNNNNKIANTFKSDMSESTERKTKILLA